MFADPNLLGKLATNPRTQKHLADPAFVQKVSEEWLSISTTNCIYSPFSQIKMIQQNPRLANACVFSVHMAHEARLYLWNNDSVLQDPRMIDVLGVLMGVDMQGYSREEGSDELPPGVSKSSMDSPPSSPPPKPAASTSRPTPAPAPAAEPEDVEMTEEDQEEVVAKKEAEAAKKAGSEAYKKRDFEEATKNFEKAWDLWPKDITFLTNLGGMSSLFPCALFARNMPMCPSSH
jgi:stress-induced-phosphoprotein 1